MNRLDPLPLYRERTFHASNISLDLPCVYDEGYCGETVLYWIIMLIDTL